MEGLRDRVAQITAVGILVMGIPIVASFAVTDFQARLTWMGVSFFVAIAVGVVAIRSGHGLVGRLLILGAMAAQLLARAWLYGGVTSVPYTAWVVVVILGAILLGARVAWIATGVGVAAGLLLYRAEAVGALPAPLREDSAGTALRISSALFVIVGLLTWATVRRIEEGMVKLAGASEERRFLLERYRHRALHDPLTGLPNRDLFLDRVDQALMRGRRSEAADFAVVFFDLDRFKVINDSLGHATGDALLVELADRVKEVLRGADTVARLGGDEFTVLLHGVVDEAACRAAVSRILRVFDTPFRVGEHEISVKASAGIVLGDSGYRDALDILRDADIAMYAAKEQPLETITIFDPAMRREVHGLHALDNELRAALDADAFVPWFQPIVDLETREIVGVEALARWPHGGEVRSPAAFIPRAEETGLVRRLDRQIVAKACAAVAPRGELTLNVNLSAQQFLDPGLVDWLLGVLAETRLPARRLVVEVTESTLLGEFLSTRRAFARLREAGARIAIDDFGTGHSALSYLHRFELSCLKIDTSFVQERGPAGPGPICEAILSVADKLGIDKTAEGIETEAQRARLIELGCRVGQGFLFGRPAPIEDLF